MELIPFIAAVDPGFSGGVALLDPVNRKLLSVGKMPTRTECDFFGGSKRPTINVERLAGVLKGASTVVVEKVTASPQMGVTSAFRFGEGYGCILGILGALEIPARFVTPSVWKTSLNLGRDKTKSIDLACKLFPDFATRFRSDSKSADLSEAALLAWYGLKLIDMRTFTD